VLLNKVNTMNTTHTEQGKLPWWKQNLSLLILTGLFAGMAMLVPMDIVERFQALFKVEHINTEAPFQDKTAELDRQLEQALPADQHELKERRADIMIRRLLRAGPLTGVEVKEIKKMLLEIDAQASKEHNEGAKNAWQNLRLKNLATYPRLDQSKVKTELQTFEIQYKKAMSR